MIPSLTELNDSVNLNSLNIYFFAEQLRPKINDAIARLETKTCLTFREVDSSYGGDHIKMHKGNGLDHNKQYMSLTDTS